MSKLNFPVFGMVFGKGGTFTSGVPLDAQRADTSVEIEKYTVDGTTSGNLDIQHTRHISGEHVSISKRESPPSAGAGDTVSVTEEKVFYLDSDRGKSSGFADWTIFSPSGVAVGDPSGTTRIDITPAATFNNTPGETPV